MKNCPACGKLKCPGRRDQKGICNASVEERDDWSRSQIEKSIFKDVHQKHSVRSKVKLLGAHLTESEIKKKS